MYFFISLLCLRTIYTRGGWGSGEVLGVKDKPGTGRFEKYIDVCVHICIIVYKHNRLINQK